MKHTWKKKNLEQAGKKTVKLSKMIPFLPARPLLEPSPLGRGVAVLSITSNLLWVTSLLGVQEFAPGTFGTDAFLGKVGTNQRVLLLALPGKRGSGVGKGRENLVGAQESTAELLQVQPTSC